MLNQVAGESRALSKGSPGRNTLKDQPKLFGELEDGTILRHFRGFPAAMSHSEALSRPSIGDSMNDKSMNRTFLITCAAVTAAGLFAGLVYAVLAAAHVAEPARTTIYGLTARRVWATAAAMLALVGIIIGALALARPGGRFGVASGRLRGIVALVAGLIAGLNGGMNLAIANGGPGTGNGVVGGAAAVVLGLIALALGGLALARHRRTALDVGQIT